MHLDCLESGELCLSQCYFATLLAKIDLSLNSVHDEIVRDLVLKDLPTLVEPQPLKLHCWNWSASGCLWHLVMILDYFQLLWFLPTYGPLTVDHQFSLVALLTLLPNLLHSIAHLERKPEHWKLQEICNRFGKEDNPHVEFHGNNMEGSLSNMTKGASNQLSSQVCLSRGAYKDQTLYYFSHAY